MEQRSEEARKCPRHGIPMNPVILGGRITHYRCEKCGLRPYRAEPAKERR
jgi:hypothetical protein